MKWMFHVWSPVNQTQENKLKIKSATFLKGSFTSQFNNKINKFFDNT